MSIRILHLSDTHLLSGDGRHYGLVDTAAALHDALAELADLATLDLVVCSGDVSEDGSEESYRRARELLIPWAEERGADVVFAMGNHDVRSAFSAILGDGQFPHQPVDLSPRDGAIVSSRTRKGLRTIVLDTTVPGAGYGFLDEEQLAFLRAEMRRPSESGSVVVMHHAPVDAQTELLQGLALQNPGAFFEAIRGGDVRAVLAGHYHHPLIETVDGVPVIVTGAVTNRARPFADPREESAGYGSTATLVTLGTRGVRAVPYEIPHPRSTELVFRLDAMQVAEIVRAAGPR